MAVPAGTCPACGHPSSTKGKVFCLSCREGFAACVLIGRIKIERFDKDFPDGSRAEVQAYLDKNREQLFEQYGGR